MLPIVDSEAGAHTEKENISLRCYIEGTKLLASYFYQLQKTATKQEKISKKSQKCAKSFLC